jgi:hypothetical protein
VTNGQFDCFKDISAKDVGWAIVDTSYRYNITLLSLPLLFNLCCLGMFPAVQIKIILFIPAGVTAVG